MILPELFHTGNKNYYKISIEPLRKLPKPILSRRWRRIVFIQSTWEKFINAVEINDLFNGSVLEDKLWAEFKRLGIDIERQELVQIDNRFYFLDFADHCMKGKLDIETDGDFWHHNPSSASQDNQRNNDLTLEGWQILRFTANQINEQLQSYCIPQITHHINQFGGIKIDDSFQYSIFDI
jgi:very-short-patch-repair endonuclease